MPATRHNDWPVRQLGEVIELFDNRRVPLNSRERGARQGVYPYYGAQGIIDYIDGYLFDGRYILVAEDGENLNSKKLPLALFAEGKFWVNNHAHILRANAEVADDTFLLACLNHADIKPYVTGAAQPKLSQANLRLIEIPVPPLPVQHRIAVILSVYDELMENNTRRIHILEQMAQALHREWFVNFRFPGHAKVKLVESPMGKIPQGWLPGRLGDIAGEVRRGVNPDDVEPDTPYIGLEHLPRKSIALSEWGTAKQVQSTKLAFKKGEILFGKIRPYFHKVGVAAVDGVCSTDAIVILPKKPEYFALVLACVSNEPFVSHATQTSQGTKMPRANWEVLTKYPLPMPPAPLLSKFSAFVNEAIALVQNLVFKNRNLRRTRDLLLPKLVSGALDVSKLDIVNP